MLMGYRTAATDFIHWFRYTVVLGIVSFLRLAGVIPHLSAAPSPHRLGLIYTDDVTVHLVPTFIKLFLGMALRRMASLLIDDECAFNNRTRPKCERH